ncbi:response regulator [Rhizobium sp. SIMBA_035]
MPEEKFEGQLVIVCAPFGRDAETIAMLLQEQRYNVGVCRDLRDVATKIQDDVGVVVLTEESMSGNLNLTELKLALDRQPSWSDIPFILLSAPRSARRFSEQPAALSLFEAVRNCVVLERPLGKASITSAVASALRLRQKQFQMRDRVSDLDESEARLRLATRAAKIGIWDFDPVSNHLRWDDRCKAVFGIRGDAKISYEDTFLAGLHPADRDMADNAVKAALQPGGTGEFDIEYRTVGLEDQTERWVAAKGGAIFVDGHAVRFIGTVIDITERKRIEERLAASEAALRCEQQRLDELTRTLEERVTQRTQALEEQMAARSQAEDALRQAQKMEAVGQLTGGIAHDFNNMLTGIIGGINIARRRIAKGQLDDVDRFMDAATDSANRAAALIARLLAFSRRQTLDAKPFDVHAQLLATRDLLRRTLPENIEIILEASAGNVMADANQLESALLNMAVNARDAMPEGGRLLISSFKIRIDRNTAKQHAGLKAGEYVAITVTDTGFGMPKDVVARAFDPFYTTKPIGQGTGLGLSMIYGFAQQSNGHVEIESMPGTGTTIRLLLPSTDHREDVESHLQQELDAAGSGQKVLVVEDDDAVRFLISEVLADLSYEVLEAATPDAALPIIMSEQSIDLLISDVGLPGMNGRQLAEIARQQRPELPILFVTGYAENATIKSDFLGSDMAMIAKPFSNDVLASTIRDMISSKS